jgi:hypothetical protein
MNAALDPLRLPRLAESCHRHGPPLGKEIAPSLQVAAGKYGTVSSAGIRPAFSLICDDSISRTMRVCPGMNARRCKKVHRTWILRMSRNGSRCARAAHARDIFLAATFLSRQTPSVDSAFRLRAIGAAQSRFGVGIIFACLSVEGGVRVASGRSEPRSGERTSKRMRGHAQSLTPGRGICPRSPSNSNAACDLDRKENW